jgi:flagellar motor switch protein FliM
MSEKILTQEEIDALLKGVAGGQVETTPKDAMAAGGITSFNFAGHERVIRGRMAALDAIHDRFCKLFNVTVSRAMHRPVGISVQGKEIQKFGNLLSRLALPSFLILFKMDPLRGTALLAMDASFVYPLTDHYFGGNGQVQAMPESRDFTHIQQRVIRNIGGLAIRDLEKAWKPTHSIKTEILRVETDPQNPLGMTTTDLAVVTTLRLQMSETTADFFICYPYALLEPIKERLSAGYISNNPEADQQWTARFLEEIQLCSMEMSVELGRATIHVQDLMNFTPGDVILLDKGQGDPVLASIEGLPKFTGIPGIVKGQQALQIVSVLKPGT